MNFRLEPIQFIIFLILIKWAAVMIVAALLAYFNYFADRLFAVSKTVKTRYILASLLASVFVICLILRYRAGYHAIDISIPGLFITGAVLGFLPSLVASGIVAIVYWIFSGEYYSILLGFVSALAGSVFYRENLFENRRKIYRVCAGMLPVSILILILNRYAPYNSIFSLSNRTIEGDIVVAISDLVAVFLVFFVWNHHINKVQLVEKNENLLQARLAVLSSKIKPHFLFNTLNTIASAIRINPEIAREIVFSLAEILRYILKTENEFKPLRDEIDFVDNYLSIESFRFGESRLQVVMDIEEETKELNVPAMLLQPLVENSIKHGVSSLTDRKGVISIHSALDRNDRNNILRLVVADNGAGMEMKEDALFASGIGLSNVRDRLRLLFGDKAGMQILSEPGRGTNITLLLPVRR
ncbi:MAG: histidine kinase [Oligoflexia bacterium]|nr:histidine kinase [Oligoflexia bacterium]